MLVERVLVGAFLLGLAAILAAVFVACLPLLITGGVLVAGVFTLAPILITRDTEGD